MPRGVAIRAAEVATGERVPAVPRDAATLVLLRPGSPDSSDFEVLLLCRTRAMDFAPGAHVFPGGSVDPDDADVPWSGPAPQGLGVPPERAQRLACAAIRETYEESGGLLAGSAVADLAALAQDRRALLAGEVSFGEVLTRRGL